MTNYELTMKNGKVVMIQLDNALVEQIDNVISIHADHGFMMDFPVNDIESEEHTDERDIYSFTDGSRLVLEQA